jgi:capsular exopolysaccharide synthesis family protein
MTDQLPGRFDSGAAGVPTPLPSERGRRGYPGYPGYPGGYPGQEQQVALGDLWRVLRRQGWVIVLAFTIVVGVTIYLTSQQVPVWQSSTLIRIEGEEGGGDVPMLFTQQFGGGGELETEMHVVSTRPILSLVVDSLDLGFQVNLPPGGPRHALFAEISLNRDSEGKTYNVSRLSRDLYRVEATSPPDSGVSARFLRAGDEFKAGDRVVIPGGFFTVALESDMRSQDLDPPTNLVISTMEFVEAVTGLQGDVLVSRPDAEASLFEISLSGTDPALVRDMVNEIANAFLDQRRTIQKTEATSTVAFLSDQSDLYLTNLERMETELQEFRESEQVVALESDADEKVRRLASIQADRAQVAGERDALGGLLADIADSGVEPDYVRLVSFPTFLQTEAITAVVARLIEAQQQRTAARERWTERHPGIVVLDAQINELEARLGDVGRNYYESLNGELKSLDETLEIFGEELKSLPGRELRFERLRREVQLTGDLHTLLQTRLKEAEISEAVEDPSVRVIEPAIYPRVPVRPRPRQNLTLGAFLGLVLGVGIAFVREQMDQAIRSNEDIEQILGLPVLSRVPHMVADKRGRASQLITAQGEDNKRGYGGSVSAEAYRILRTNVLFAPSESSGTDGAISGRELVITSAGAQEGKSVTSSNLAVTFAQQGHRTVIIDADLRRSTLHRTFEIPRQPGLANYLAGKFEVSDVIRETGIENLFIVPAGDTPTNPTELLGSQMMDQLLEHVRESYDCLVLDTPPVLSMADAAVLGGKVDGVLLVVRAGRTHRKAAQDSIAQLTRVGAEVLGVVMNDSAPAGRYGYRYSYYYDYYAKDVADTSKSKWKRLFSRA